MSTSLNNDSIFRLLSDLSAVCIKFGINGFSIEENVKGKMVRGMGNKGQGMSPIVLCHPLDIDIPFQGMAISNPVKLNAALNVFKATKTTPTITLDIDPTRKIVKSFEMKSGRTKIKYMCANPASITSPKNITDVPTYKVEFNEESVKTISLGVKAIEHDSTQQTYITLSCNGSTTQFTITGMSKDELSYDLPNSVDIHTGVSSAFQFKYPVSSLINFLNMSDNSTLIIGKRGVITNTLNSYSYHLFPII